MSGNESQVTTGIPTSSGTRALGITYNAKIGVIAITPFNHTYFRQCKTPMPNLSSYHNKPYSRWIRNILCSGLFTDFGSGIPESCLIFAKYGNVRLAHLGGHHNFFGCHLFLQAALSEQETYMYMYMYIKDIHVYAAIRRSRV